MRILIVAPQSNLPALAEFIAAAEGNNPEILHGAVTIAYCINRMSSGLFDIVHFIAHGDASALQMTDGMMDTQHLQNAVNAAITNGRPIRLIVLNACRSVTLGADIKRLGMAAPSFVIGWRNDVPNDVAIEFADRFYDQIRIGDGIGEAYDKAKRIIERRPDNPESPILLNGAVDNLRQELALAISDVAKPMSAWKPSHTLFVMSMILLMVMLVALVVYANVSGLIGP